MAAFLALDPLGIASRRLPPEAAALPCATWSAAAGPAEPVRVGQRVGKFGHTFLWSELHWPAERLQPWRQHGDPACDALLDALRPGPADDVVQAAADAAGSAQPPADAEGARRHALLVSWHRSVREVPAWVDWEQLERGQQVFTVNAPAAALSLYYLSLVGGFSAPLITRVLRATAYLTAPPKKVMRRLVDTGAMVAACTTGGAASLRPGGAGWTAVLQVRVLHAKVRQRLGERKYWRRDEWGVPINQEDMAVSHAARFILPGDP